MQRQVKILGAVLVLLIFTSACSNKSDEPKPKDEVSTLDLQNNCSDSDFEEGSRWIKGQLKAFGDPNPSSAYGFASADFRAANSIEDFTSIIVNQYPMLLDLEKFEIYSCDSADNYFLFKVRITGNDGTPYWMEYLLSRIDGAWGVDGATVANKPTNS